MLFYMIFHFHWPSIFLFFLLLLALEIYQVVVWCVCWYCCCWRSFFFRFVCSLVAEQEINSHWLWVWLWSMNSMNFHNCWKFADGFAFNFYKFFVFSFHNYIYIFLLYLMHLLLYVVYLYHPESRYSLMFMKMELQFYRNYRRYTHRTLWHTSICFEGPYEKSL